MKTRDFHALTQQAVSPLLEIEHHFQYKSGTYFRERAGGVHQLVTFDFDGQRPHAFRVMMGINVAEFSDGRPPWEAGFLGQLSMLNAGGGLTESLLDRLRTAGGRTALAPVD